MKITEPSVYTTGKIARLCSVSIRTVARWIESNDLKAYRLPGDATEYRVAQQDLLKFLKKFDLPYEHIEDIKIHDILLIDKNASTSKAIQTALDELDLPTKLTLCTDMVTAAIKIGLLIPSAIFIDPTLSGIDAKRLIEEIQSDNSLNGVKVIVVNDPKKLTQDDVSALEKLNGLSFLPRPVSKKAILQTLSFLLD